MIILTLRTDRPEAEIGLYDDTKRLKYETWEGHRQLAESLHLKIKGLLDSSGKDWRDVEGVVVYEGPGSFTGLRIGISVANALAYANSINIIGTTGDDWISLGLAALKGNKAGKTALPQYGSEAHITLPRK